MPLRIVAEPEEGFPGKMQDGDTWVQGTYRMVAYVFAPEEVPPRGTAVATIDELRAKYWNAKRHALVIRFPSRGPHTYEFGHALLKLSGAALVHVRPEFSWRSEGPMPQVCSCGELSLRHAVEYHVNSGK
jgi:hypothetical protein